MPSPADAPAALTVSLNGTPHALALPSLEAVFGALGIGAEVRHVAVAVNDVVVTRARWADVVLAEGDRIEVITAVAGG